MYPLEEEEWRPVLGFEGEYEVSNLGRVRSLTRTFLTKSGHTMTKRGRLLVQTPSKGYYRMTLWFRQTYRTLHVHEMVLDAFVGPRLAGMQACHNDGNPFNNRADNLRWGDGKENMADREKHGRTSRGEKHPDAKLTEAQVIEIRKMRGRLSQVKLAERYGVDQTIISDIQLGKIWRHVGGPIAQPLRRDRVYERRVTNSKIGPDEVAGIKVLRGVLTNEQIAKIWGVSRGTVQSIHNGRSWTDVPATILPPTVQ